MADDIPPERAGPRQPRGQEDFEEMYRTTPPWDIGRPQPAFLALADAGGLGGKVLDAGCGTGEHTLMAAERGFDATGIDMVQTAIAAAEEKARRRGLKTRFLVWDALQLPALGEQFDTVLDCGLFHVLDDDDRSRYLDSLRAVVGPGGRYFMLCFSDRQPGDWGPRRVTEAEIRDCFADGWRIDALDPSVIEVTLDPAGAQSWFVAMTRL